MKKGMTRESDIILGDSFQVLKLLKPKSFQLLIADPPYHQKRVDHLWDSGKKGINYYNNQDFDHAGWLKVAVGLLKNKGSIILWNNWDRLERLSVRLKEYSIQTKRIIVWNQTNPVNLSSDRSFIRHMEFALWGVKTTGTKEDRWVFNKRENLPYESCILNYPGSRKHSTFREKPVEVYKDLVEILSNPGDWVLDPFAGTGVVASAAEQLGRNSISIEKTPDTFQKAIERFQNVRQGKPRM